MNHYEIDSSIEDAEIVELYEFWINGTTVFRWTSGSERLMVDGNTFFVETIQRTSIQVNTPDKTSELTIQVPVSNPLSQRYLERGLPPNRVEVTIWRYYADATDNKKKMIWNGFITSEGVRGRLGSFRVPDYASERLRKRLPTITVGRECPHVLFDSNCRVNKTLHRVLTTVLENGGTTMKVASMGGNPSGWAQYGWVEHPASGERVYIAEQIDNKLTLNQPMIDANAGHDVIVYRGCAHNIPACKTFNNVANYGGYPHLPRRTTFNLLAIGIHT